MPWHGRSATSRIALHSTFSARILAFVAVGTLLHGSANASPARWAGTLNRERTPCPAQRPEPQQGESPTSGTAQGASTDRQTRHPQGREGLRRAWGLAAVPVGVGAGGVEAALERAGEFLDKDRNVRPPAPPRRVLGVLLCPRAPARHAPPPATPLWCLR
jgi:hypothetical protein